MRQQKKPPRALLILAFIAVYFIWGTTYLAIAYAVKGFGPFAISAMRYLAAGTILSVWALATKKVWPAGKDWRVLIISGILMLSGGTGLVVVGEKYISSGSAAVIMATEPLFFILLDKARWKSYFSSKWIIIGLLIGFAGIALFACFTPAGATATSRPVLGTIITLLSAVAWVAGALYANYRLTSKTGTSVHSAVQLLAAGLFSGVVAVIHGEWPAVFSGNVACTAWAGVAYLTVMGSLVAYLAFNWLLTVQPPAIVSTHTYVNPVIAVFIGWLVASEQVTLFQLIALVVVIAGVVITQSNKSKIAE
ncbi:EamA family transporter [Deminuibacter soli]|uniref:EamA family transporter n=1 Tax=Deminuibacter soli TaxID=2291815 RepID=A0A3E1NFS5_9BACT|nr:EamA family transporter [Deminuibacter soli]RFM26820.1 EamA family transporter [Deminuibacter soli]